MSDYGSTAQITVIVTVSVDSGDLPTEEDFSDDLLRRLQQVDPGTGAGNWYSLEVSPVSEWNAEDMQ